MNQAEIAYHFESTVKRYANRFLLILIAGLTTVVAVLAIIPRWTAYSSWSKLEAVIFVFVLVTTPSLEILREKRAHLGGPFQGAITGYFLAILAMTLFAIH